MLRPLRYLLFVVLFLAFSQRSSASHLMGGTLTYTFISGSQYKITLKMYRDCNSGTPLDPSIDVHIYADDPLNPTNPDKNEDQTVTIDKISESFISPVFPPGCTFTPSNLCIQEGIYEKTINL